MLAEVAQHAPEVGARHEIDRRRGTHVAVDELDLDQAIDESEQAASTGDDQILSAPEAERWGLVTKAIPLADLEHETSELARELANGPTLVLGYTKSAVVHGWQTSPETAYRFQGQALSHAQRTEDFNEGIQAFREKRPPRFRGR